MIVNDFIELVLLTMAIGNVNSFKTFKFRNGTNATQISAYNEYSLRGSISQRQKGVEEEMTI